MICGMEAEAAALGQWRDDPRVFIGISGAQPDRAEALALEAADQGAKVLVSWGLAGGLAADLKPGTLIQPDCVSHPDGSQISFRTQPYSTGLIAGSDAVVASPAEKLVLRQGTGAAAVDMETHRLAQVAMERELDLKIIRAISDPADRALPTLAATALGTDGRPMIGRVLLGLIRRSWQLSALLAAKRDSDAALATLRGAKELISEYVNG